MKIISDLSQFSLSMLSQKTLEVLRDKELTVGFAESCTGGLLSSSMTQISGASKVFWGAIVSYDNSIKENVLGVKASTLQSAGAVSAECAAEMVSGALRVLKTDWAVAVTGIAGPNGGSDLKPVGTVYIAVGGTKKATEVFHHDFTAKNEKKYGTQNGKELKREEIQQQACAAALDHLLQILNRE